jgi:hypothetical protein
MDYFAGLARLYCRPRRRGGSREQDSVDGRRDRQRIGESARLSSDRLRDGTNGADPVPRVEPNRLPRGLRREPAGLPGAQVARHPQDRSQRRARSGAFGPHRILQARAREVFVGPRRPLAHHRAQEAGRPAGDLGKPDPRLGGRVRNPTASRAHRCVRRSGAQGKRGGGRPIRRNTRSDRRANCGNDGCRCDRLGHETDDEGLGGLQPVDDDPGAPRWRSARAGSPSFR